MRGLLARRIAAVVVLCIFAFSAVPAFSADIVSTMRNVNAVGEANGFRINPAFDRTADRGPNDLSQPQAFEILRPLDKGVTIGRLYTSCTCIQLEAPKRSFEPGERAILQLRNIKETPTNGQIYAIYVQITSPIRATLRFDTFVQSNNAINPLTAESEAPAPAAPAAVAATATAAGEAVTEDRLERIPDIEVIVPKGPLDEKAAEAAAPESVVEKVAEEVSEVVAAVGEASRSELQAARDELDAIMSTRSADLSASIDPEEDAARDALNSYFEESAAAPRDAVVDAAVAVRDAARAASPSAPSSAPAARTVTSRTAPLGDAPVRAVSLITVGVRDMARSIAFYEGIGWKRAARTKYDSTAFFQLHGQVLALYPQEDMLKEQNMSDARPAPGGITLAIHVQSRDEVYAAYRRFVDAGGVALKEPTAMPSGAVTCYVADPDGNPWEISWVPQFVIDEDGGLWLR